MYYIDLAEYPFTDVIPIIKWCLENDICRKQCIEQLSSWPSMAVKINWVLELTDEQAVLFLLAWSGTRRGAKTDL